MALLVVGVLALLPSWREPSPVFALELAQVLGMRFPDVDNFPPPVNLSIAQKIGAVDKVAKCLISLIIP